MFLLKGKGGGEGAGLSSRFRGSAHVPLKGSYSGEQYRAILNFIFSKTDNDPH
jgi:hypothetical protein